jgi:acyl carrier protein
VLAPKVLGALHLHQLTCEIELDFFVLFSSAAALIGAPGQSNYAAANAALDAVALVRRARRLPALSVNWGAFSQVGMAAQQESRGQRLVHRGVIGMSPADGLDALGALLEHGIAHVAVIALDARQWLESSPHLARSQRFSELAAEASRGRSAGSARTKLRDLASLRAAPPDELRSRLALLLRQEVGRILRIDPKRIEPQVQLMSLGFDSLLSLELRNRLESLLGLSLPAVLLWTYPTLESLTQHLAEELQPAEAAAVPNPPVSAGADASAPSAGAGADVPAEVSGEASGAEALGAEALGEGDLDDLSEEERALLEERLASLTRRL